MAKLLNPLLSTEASGTMSGLTYANNMGLRQCRRKPMRKSGSTIALRTARGRIGYYSRYWSLLTAAQRAGWNGYAQSQVKVDRLGVAVGQSGYSCFVEHMIAKVAAGFGITPMTVPPSGIQAMRIATLVLTTSGVPNGFKATWTADFQTTPLIRFEYQVTREMYSAAREPQDNMWGVKAHVAQTVLTVTITTARKDCWFGFRVRCVTTDGRCSEWIRDKIKAA